MNQVRTVPQEKLAKVVQLVLPAQLVLSENEVSKVLLVQLDSRAIRDQSVKLESLASPVRLVHREMLVFLANLELVANVVLLVNEAQLVQWASPAQEVFPVFLVMMVKRVPRVRKVLLAPQDLKVLWDIMVTAVNKVLKDLLVSVVMLVLLEKTVQRV